MVSYIDQIRSVLWKYNQKYQGSAEIWTRIAGFRVLSANRYTTEPTFYKVLGDGSRDLYINRSSFMVIYRIYVYFREW